MVILSSNNQVTPFDIVEEFNRSVEHWVHSVLQPPGAAMINATIMQIAQFLAEFASGCEPAPPFLRLGVNMPALASFKVTFNSIKELLLDGGVSGEGSTEEEKAQNPGQNPGPNPGTGLTLTLDDTSIALGGSTQGGGIQTFNSKAPVVMFPTQQMVGSRFWVRVMVRHRTLNTIF
jgi:hypothetical protein